MISRHKGLIKRLQKHGSNGFAIGWDAASVLEKEIAISDRRKAALERLLDALARNTLFGPNGHWEAARQAIED